MQVDVSSADVISDTDVDDSKLVTICGVGDWISMLVTSFECWCPNRHQHLIDVTKTFRLQNRCSRIKFRFSSRENRMNLNKPVSRDFLWPIGMPDTESSYCSHHFLLKLLIRLEFIFPMLTNPMKETPTQFEISSDL